MAAVDLGNKRTSVLLITYCIVFFLISNGLLLHGATLNSTSSGQRNPNSRLLNSKSSQYKNITAKPRTTMPENSTEPDESIHFIVATPVPLKPVKGESLSNKIADPKLPNRYVPSVDEACSKNNATYCKRVKNYPKSVINNLIRKNEVPHNAFSNEETDTLGTRIGGQGEQDYLCQSHIEVIYPEVAKTKTDQWKYVIQGTEQDTNIWKQGIQVETCGSAENKPCQLIPEVLPNGYHAYCEQKYLYRKLYALGHDGVPNYEDFKIPSCCQCVAHS